MEFLREFFSIGYFEGSLNIMLLVLIAKKELRS